MRTNRQDAKNAKVWICRKKETLGDLGDLGGGQHGLAGVLVAGGNDLAEPHRLADFTDRGAEHLVTLADLDRLGPVELVERLTEEMYRAAKNLDFETAASLRDRIEELELENELRGPDSVNRERQRNARRKGRGRN